jgi:hypothetical protein
MQWALLETAETMPHLNAPYQHSGTASDHGEWITNIILAIHRSEVDHMELVCHPH